MLVMVVFFIAFRWIHLSTPLIRLFLLVLILLLMPTLNFLPFLVPFDLFRVRLPPRPAYDFIPLVVPLDGGYFPVKAWWLFDVLPGPPGNNFFFVFRVWSTLPLLNAADWFR